MDKCIVVTALVALWCVAAARAYGSEVGTRPCTQLLTNTENYSGMWRSTLNLPVKTAGSRWQATIRFSRPVTGFTNTLAQTSTADSTVFLLRVFPHKATYLPANSQLQLDFEVRYTGSAETMFIESVHFNGTLACSADNTLVQLQQPQPSANRRRLKYDYGQAIDKSILFYEAQRSGLLPIDNRIPWRNDSCLNDKGNANEDLTGGYFSNGRTLKFTFPNAAAMTVMAWGILSNENGYKLVGQLDYAKDALSWGTLYLEKCHPRPNEVYALVGDVGREISEWWGRPEDINFPRPAYKVNTASPGSELAAETAAALAASSIVYDTATYPDRKRSHIEHAIQLYNFATKYRGDYSQAVPQVSDFYRSWNGDEDELVWAALWLYRATEQERYLEDAKRMYQSFRMSERKPSEFSWDDKTMGIRVLMASFTLDPIFEREAEEDCNRLALNSSLRNPQGLFHIGHPVGAIRYASNLAFVCYELGQVLMSNRGLGVNPYLEFAVSQVNFVLGDSGRSFMVGFGNNYPQRIHHSASSCPKFPAECGWKNKNANTANVLVLNGALVGGPDRYGNYEDSRDNYSQNDVGVDYNAGFQSLLAAFIQLHDQNKLSNNAYDSSNAYG